MKCILTKDSTEKKTTTPWWSLDVCWLKVLLWCSIGGLIVIYIVFVKERFPGLGSLWKILGLDQIKQIALWQVAAITWSLIFTVIFYFKFDTSNKKLNKALPWLLIGFFFGGCFILYFQLKTHALEKHLTIYMFCLAIMFLIIDFLFYKYHELWETRYEFFNNLVFVDLPVVVSLLVIMIFSNICQQTGIREFMAGSTAFQLIFQNIIFAFLQESNCKINLSQS